MNKRKIFVLVGFLFLLLAALSVYLFILLKGKPTPSEKQALEEVGKTLFAPRPDVPITKTITTEKDGIVYELEGKFTGKLEKSDKLLTGTFVLKNDPLERRIRVFVGRINGNTLFGTYDGSFNDESTWKSTSSDIVLELVKVGEPVRIRINLPLNDNLGLKKYTKEREDVLDTLIREFQIDEFSYEIPADFVLVADRLGVIR